MLCATAAVFAAVRHRAHDPMQLQAAGARCVPRCEACRNQPRPISFSPACCCPSWLRGDGVVLHRMSRSSPRCCRARP